MQAETKGSGVVFDVLAELGPDPGGEKRLPTPFSWLHNRQLVEGQLQDD